MPQSNLKVKDIDGALPALDVRASVKPYVIDGRNYLFDIQGPKSGFGSKIVSQTALTAPKYFKSFRVGTDMIYFGETTAWKFNPTLQVFYAVAHYTSTGTSLGAWTYARIANQHFFCHPSINGVLYCTETEPTMFMHPSGALPSNPIAVAKCFGRLVVVGNATVGWSALDNGLDLTPSLTTGAGFQALSILGGTSITLAEVDDGIFVFTTNGILKGIYNGRESVFSWRPFSNEHTPMNQHGVVKLADGTVIILTRTGFFKTRGQLPQIWQPVFGEYIRRVVRSYNQSRKTTFRLTYIESESLLFLSFNPIHEYLYDSAFVIYLPLEKWGRFNRAHHAITEVFFASGANYGYKMGYVDADGLVSFFNGGDHVEEMPTLDNSGGAFYHQPLVQPAVYYDNTAGCYVFPSAMRMTAEDLSPLASSPAGYYQRAFFEYVEAGLAALTQDPDTLVAVVGEDWLAGPTPDVTEDWMALADSSEDWMGDPLDTTFPSKMQIADSLNRALYSALTMTTAGLDSEIIIGLLRFDEAQFNDEISEVNGMTIGGARFADLNSESEDWMTIPDGTEDEDYMTLADSQEDWGSGVSGVNTFGVEVLATHDGTNEFNSTTPALALQTDPALFFTMLLSGIFIKLRVFASGVGQSYHLRFLEMAGRLAGRL
jgi:hypothetical protein